MTYFKMRPIEAAEATERIWRQQDDLAVERTLFDVRTNGSFSTVSTEDTEGEKLLRQILDYLGTHFEEVEEPLVDVVQ